MPDEHRSNIPTATASPGPNARSQFCNEYQLDTSADSALAKTGLLRLASILAPRGPIPVSKSTWWAGVKSGRYPKPLKLGPRITAWRVEDIRVLIQAGSES